MSPSRLARRASSRTKSSGLVSFILATSPSKVATVNPAHSAIAASSVKSLRPSCAARRCASRMTSKRKDCGVCAIRNRARLRIAQTPQSFRFDVILEAHRRAAQDGRSDFTDDAAIAEWAGLTVATFEGDVANMKLTNPEDFVREEARLASLLGDIRTGTGYDVHAFGEGDHVMICGVRVPHSKGFLAHSDGDVGLHALV